MIAPELRRLLLAAAVVALACACLLVLRPFIVPILWAAALAYTVWPLYLRLRALLRGWSALSAGLMTLIIGCVVVLPVLWMLALVQGELASAYHQLRAYLSQGGPALSEWVGRVPWVGARLQAGLQHALANPSALARQAGTYMLSWASRLGSILGGVGRNLFKLALTLLTLFFFFRDGETIVAQGRQVLRHFFQERLDPYIVTAGRMTRAVLYGLLVTAFVQGLIAGIGYRVIGLTAPVLLGVLTAILSFVPLAGTAIVWVPVSIGLMLTGHPIKGVILIVWGVLLVHPAEDVLRPLLISSAVRVPFLLVLFGALGGLAAFGLIGLFAGPVLLAIGVALWREWATSL
ncbi:MAG TPA: AI-2E family transporter [Steroidobacteraceae bacterium]|nr:AI-2E family transporter [Steroidobacteraceae bacterium]